MADPSLCIGENHGAVLELLINLTLFSIVLDYSSGNNDQNKSKSTFP